jgi:hypothetical protein
LRQENAARSGAAIGVFQITFTDLDLAAWPGTPSNLALFAYNGLVDANLAAKPALAAWDHTFARPGALS